MIPMLNCQGIYWIKRMTQIEMFRLNKLHKDQLQPWDQWLMLVEETIFKNFLRNLIFTKDLNSHAINKLMLLIMSIKRIYQIMIGDITLKEIFTQSTMRLMWKWRRILENESNFWHFSLYILDYILFI